MLPGDASHAAWGYTTLGSKYKRYKGAGTATASREKTRSPSSYEPVTADGSVEAWGW